jgi:hypothetical protein
MADIDFGAVKYPPTDAEKLDELKRRKIRDINAAYSERAAPLVSEYPELEQKTWPSQNAEAAAYLAWYEDPQGEAPQTPVLDAILAGRNGDGGSETMFDLCVVVMGNAKRFTQFQYLTGKRQRLVKQVRGAETKEAVGAISW